MSIKVMISKHLTILVIVLYCNGDFPYLHSFPTRRSSDLSPRRNDPRVKAAPRQLRVQPPELDLGAAVHHDLEACSLSPFRRRIVAHAQLHPDDLDLFFVLQSDGLVNDPARRL